MTLNISTLNAAEQSEPHWSRDAVVYQVYPRSFADANGDGIGDLAGIVSKLDHLVTLGVDALWLSPFYRSPQKDGGYDVADFCSVDPMFGTVEDFHVLIDQAHERGLRVIVDIVPNHTSDEHEWFVEALNSPEGSEERARYFFTEGTGENGELPPNNWQSAFGGPAWTRTTNSDGSLGQWYLHLFDTSQPDLDWSNPWVADRFDEILQWWLDAGVDGFRVDVASGLLKEPGLPDFTGDGIHPFGVSPFRGQTGVHEIFRRWRRVVDRSPQQAMLCGEVWIQPQSLLSDWARADEMHQVFNFAFLNASWSPTELRSVIDQTLADFGAVGAPATWVLSNHDYTRHGSRLASPVLRPAMMGRTPNDPPIDVELADRRGRAASMLMLALPGAAYLYQGEELGLPEALDIPSDARQDPTWINSGKAFFGRDGSRVPLPWSPDGDSFGFSETGQSWLPQPHNWGPLSATSQSGDPASALELYRAALALRREHGLGSGELRWLSAPDSSSFAFTNGAVLCVTNLGRASVPLPAGQLLLRSGHATDALLHPDETAYLIA